MHESFDKQTIQRLLTDLDRRDRRRKVFGSGSHQYRLNPPLPLPTIEAFERRHGVILPDDYRLFLAEIGNGGAGPAYGVFPLGQHDHCHDFCAWEESDLVGDLSKRFPHADAWNLPDSFWEREPDPPPDISLEEEDRMMEAWDRELEANYWDPAIMSGAMPICHLGCAYRQWLVVNGDQRGYVWDDDRADHAGIRPLRDHEDRQQTFSDWYMRWLLGALGECR
jgi:hypothetical protein